MLRRALLLSVVLAGILGSTNAWAGQTTLAVRGQVEAMAFAGDALIVARERADGSFRLERITPGAPVQTLLRMAGSPGDHYVALAASPGALALAVATDGSDNASTRVFAGPAAGPLREVATCARGVSLPAVAVRATQIAWSEGACSEGEDENTTVGPLTIVVADASPTVPVRRVPVGTETLATGIVLTGQTGIVGLLRPSLFSYLNTEVRRLGTSQLGETVVRQSGAIISPIGAFAGGDTVFMLSSADDEEEGETPDECEATMFVLAPGGTQRRPLSLGGCTSDDDVTSAGGVNQVAGDRFYGLVEQGDAKGEGGQPTALKSVRGNGAGRRLHASGTYRFPEGFAARDDGRVAWWQRRCTGGREIVIDDGAAPARSSAIRGCHAKVLTRSARVRGQHITVRLRCALGCTGFAYAETRRTSRTLRRFSLEPGTHRLRLRLTRRQRSATRIRVRFVVDSGRSPAAVIRLR
jgi:hypothetical protein